MNTPGQVMFMHCIPLMEDGCSLAPKVLLYNTEIFQTGNQEGLI